MGTTAREPARGRPARFACKLNRVWGLPGGRVGAGEHQCGQRTLRLDRVASILPGGAERHAAAASMARRIWWW